MQPPEDSAQTDGLPPRLVRFLEDTQWKRAYREVLLGFAQVAAFAVVWRLCSAFLWWLDAKLPGPTFSRYALLLDLLDVVGFAVGTLVLLLVAIRPLVILATSLFRREQ